MCFFWIRNRFHDLFFSDENQADVIKSFISTSRYFDDLFSIGNPYLEGMVNLNPPELLNFCRFFIHPKFIMGATTLIVI